jgi:hypothetical protein
LLTRSGKGARWGYLGFQIPKYRLRVFYCASLAVLTLGACQYTERLAPFASDGCSRFLDGTVTDPELWHHCCVEHDKAYWLGGDYGERMAADLRLQNCVVDAEQQALGAVMLTGVRVGGSPFWLTDYRWGYGWPYTRGYRSVTEDERKLAQSMLSGDENSAAEGETSQARVE